MLKDNERKEITNNIPIKNALISVLDKNNVDMLAEGLLKNCPNIQIFSTDGTFNAISKHIGPAATKKHLQKISEYTGQPNSEDGIAKTIHYKLFLSYLTDTSIAAHQERLKQVKGVTMDLVVANFPPFDEMIEKQHCSLEEARVAIDIGAPSTLRAGAQNFIRVMTLPSPQLYKSFLASLSAQGGSTTFKQRIEAAKKTFTILGHHDLAIAHYIANINESAFDCYMIS